MFHLAQRRARTALEAGCLLALLLTVLLTAAAGRAARYEAARGAVCADTLRLHILANSDTLADQLVKLRVRDAILAEAAPLVQNATSKRQAQAALRAALPRLAAVARRAGGQPAAVRLEQRRFAAKDYGGFYLPAGDYTALRVELGRAEGHNWFCVLYPALCIDGASAGYPDEAENSIVFGRYRVRFALWDWLQAAHRR